MSTPLFLDLPPATRAHRLATARGEFAVLDTPSSEPGTKPGPGPGPASGAVRKRPTTLLVPGFTGSKEDFIAVLGQLAEAGHRVVAVDQRGQYESAEPGPDLDPEAAYTLDALAADLLAVVEALGDGPVHILGHSFGGLVARTVALASPAAVCSLTLLCSGPAAVPAPAADRVLLMLRALEHHDLPALYETMLALDAAAGGKPPENPAVADFLRQRFVSNSPVCLRAMARQLVAEPDRVAELKALGVPVLVAYGVDDHAWPPAVQADMAMRLDCRGVCQVSIPGAAHSPAVEQPAATAAALEAFWSMVEPQ